MNLETVLTDKCKLVEGLMQEELKCISQYLEVQNYSQNDLLMKKGEPADVLMIIISGSTRVLNDDIQIGLNKVGDVIGENIFIDDGVRNGSVQAIEDTSVAVFSLNHFRELLYQNRLLALEIRKRVISIKNERESQNQGSKFIDRNKYVALIAHNEMKASLVEFCRINSDQISRFPLIATGTTGSLLYQETGMVLSKKVASGPLGGDQAVGQMISTNNIRAVIFFRDPLSSHPHHADIEALCRLCDVYQIPFATNPSTAYAVLEYINRHDDKDSFIRNRVLEKYNSGQKKVLS